MSLIDRRYVLRCALLAALPAASARAAAQAGAASPAEPHPLLRQGGGGLVVAMRHALAPGTFDPPGFRIGDCGTQRNLSEAGQEQARRIGAWYRTHGLLPGAVRTSQWCRCVDTARLAFGTAAPWAALNSFIGERSGEAPRLAELRGELARLARADTPGFQVWVTHQVNISALSKNFTGSGDAVLLRHDVAADNVIVVGALRVE